MHCGAIRRIWYVCAHDVYLWLFVRNAYYQAQHKKAKSHHVNEGIMKLNESQRISQRIALVIGLLWLRPFEFASTPTKIRKCLVHTLSSACSDM